MSYLEFLESKAKRAPELGIDIPAGNLSEALYPFQRDLTSWALRKGRAALFADTGLGKTRMELEWAHRTGARALIFTPLAVASQTCDEAAAIGLQACYVRDQQEADDLEPGVIAVTNYDRLDRFDISQFGAVVIDESSVLKNFTGATRTALIEACRPVKWRLACTATPAPNDVSELTNHAEWLGVSTRSEMLAAYFVHDEKSWRLKGHAADAMWSWVASWATAVRLPSDLGYPDDGYLLPPLRIIPHLMAVDVVPEGELFATDLGGVGGRHKVRRATLADRVAKTAELVDNDDQWIVWCGLNDEAETLCREVPDAVDVPGAWSAEDKADAFRRFVNGEIRVLSTKPSIGGFGLNLQNCHRMAFLGLSDSYESYYQCIRRCYRYGQTKPVEAHIVLSELEGQIAQNVQRKEQEATGAAKALVARMRVFQEVEHEHVA